MRYPVILILLFIVSGCSRHPVSYDADIAQVTPKSRALEILHEVHSPAWATWQRPMNESCLFSLDDVKSMKDGGVLQYQVLAFRMIRDWSMPGEDNFRVRIIRADSGKNFCTFMLGSEKKNSQGRDNAQKKISRIATAWVALGGKIAKD